MAIGETRNFSANGLREALKQRIICRTDCRICPDLSHDIARNFDIWVSYRLLRSEDAGLAVREHLSQAAMTSLRGISRHDA